jgi:pimeloyl-ACP methyl ester carboxylesterase
MNNAETIRTETLEIQGLNIRCLRAGPEDGQPLFLLHGIGVLADFWQPNIPFFAADGYAVYAPDLPGFGQSDSPKGLGTPDKIADFLAEWIRTLDHGPAEIIGHSMGGTFGLALVNRHPELVHKVLAVGPFGVGSGFKITRRSLTHLIYPSVVLSLFGWRDWAFKRIVESNFYDNSKLAPELFDLARTQGPQQKAISRFQAAAGLGIQLGLPFQRSRFVKDLSAGAAEKISVVWGEADVVLPVKHARQMKAHMPALDLHIFPEAGHALTIEQAEQFQALAQHLFRTAETP